MKKIKLPKNRNIFAMHAWMRSGAGEHTDKKKEKSRKSCRKKVDIE